MVLCNTSATNIGWQELYNGNIITAAFCMYDTAFLGWTVAILFIVYEFMLLLKTKNLTLSWVSGVLFVSLYAASVFVKSASLQFIFLILVFELGGILYFWLFK